MSYAAERWARAQTVGDARAKQVLIELAHCMNSRTGLCNPGREYLHVVTELKLSTISAATTRLEQLGFIRKIGSKGVSLRYEFPKFDPEEWKESKAETGLGTESYSVQNRTRGEAETVPTTKAETVPRVGPKPAHKQGNNKEENKEENKERFMRTSGNSSAIAAVASAQAQTPYPEDFDQSLFDEAQREALLAGDEFPKFDPEAPKRRTTTPRKKPATRCPFGPDASIPPEYLEIAQKAGIGDPQQVFSAFVNHAIAHDRSLVVWPAGFRTWCSNELRYHPNQTPKPKPLHQRTAADYDW